jgi:hypothetical protein
MENPDSDGYSDAASRTGCGEVGVPEILSGRELGGGWARRPASGVPAHIWGSDAALARGDSKRKSSRAILSPEYRQPQSDPSSR